MRAMPQLHDPDASCDMGEGHFTRGFWPYGDRRTPGRTTTRPRYAEVDPSDTLVVDADYPRPLPRRVDGGHIARRGREARWVRRSPTTSPDITSTRNAGQHDQAICHHQAQEAHPHAADHSRTGIASVGGRRRRTPEEHRGGRDVHYGRHRPYSRNLFRLYVQLALHS
jgi:hypothetical protein